jgi:N-methylhydantoinase A
MVRRGGSVSFWRVGVDSGGTFTDVCLFDGETGAIRVWKVASTPDDPSRAIAAGVDEGVRIAAGDARGGAAVGYFGHGTTVATNALIQHRGAPTGLITTDGFRDLLEIARQRRPSLYDLQADKPEPLVRRDQRIEVRERIHHDGRVEKQLDEAELRVAVRRLKADGVAAVAICFLYSYVNPAHEALAKRIVTEEFPDAFVTSSHEVAPEFREYERLSTVVVNAYLGPVMRSYLARLQPRLREIGVTAAPHLTQSNGGVISFETARESPVRTVLSGPATGVVGALTVGKLAGFDNLITFDMGGTSTDVSLIEKGEPKLAGEMTVHGYPIKAPMLDINTVGAGGGSIAYIDSGGLLKVGPRSAGADPGPVCYGRGNQEAAVTDANVVLQVLNPTHLLGGRMKIDQAAARAAIARLAEAVKLDLMATAQGIISVVTANMAKAIRVISVQRGYDPRDYTLVAFGGAGPVHAARLARELEVPRILVPKHPGILCAMGLLLTDLRSNYSMTRLLPVLADSFAAMTDAFTILERRAADWFAVEGIAPSAQLLARSIDMRYAGQNYELTVPCPAGPIDQATIERLREGFERIHKQMYGYIAPEEPIQATTFRLEATGVVGKAELHAFAAATSAVDAAIIGKRDVWLPEANGFVPCPVYDREKLGPGHRLSGPAIVEQMDATTLLIPGQTASVDRYLNLIIEGHLR